jgi:hypothetical protein
MLCKSRDPKRTPRVKEPIKFYDCHVETLALTCMMRVSCCIKLNELEYNPFSKKEGYCYFYMLFQ